MPHYMFYAPNLTSKELGGGPVMGLYPYLVNPGPPAYLIVNVGETEKAQINEEESSLLRDLCAYLIFVQKRPRRTLQNTKPFAGITCGSEDSRQIVKCVSLEI